MRKEGKIIVCPTVKIYTKISGVKIDDAFIKFVLNELICMIL